MMITHVQATKQPYNYNEKKKQKETKFVFMNINLIWGVNINCIAL